MIVKRREEIKIINDSKENEKQSYELLTDDLIDNLILYEFNITLFVYVVYFIKDVCNWSALSTIILNITNVSHSFCIQFIFNSEY